MKSFFDRRIWVLLIGIFCSIPYAFADDIEIYTNTAANTVRPPYTVLVLDLNVLGLCPSGGTNNPTNQLCLNLSTGVTLNNLLTGLGQQGTSWVTQLLTGTYTCPAGNTSTCVGSINALCALYPALNLPLPPGLSSALGTLTCTTVTTVVNLANFLGLGSLLNTVLSGFVGTLISGLVSPLLSTVVGALPSTVANLLNVALSGLVNTFLASIGIPSLIKLLEETLNTLVDSYVAIMISHGDRGSLGGSPVSVCGLADTSPRKSPPACSNGAYPLIGFTKIAGVGTVNNVLTEVTSKLNSLLNPAELLKDVTAILATTVTTPTQLLPPYQAKEVYAELSHYLTGTELYNYPLGQYDGIVGLLAPATTQMNASGATVGIKNGNNYVAPLTCDTVNVINIQLTKNTREDESDVTLREYISGLPASPTLSNVVQQAATVGIEKNGSHIKLKSYFLVQSLLGSTTDLENAGATVLEYTDSLGLLNRGKSIADLLKPTLSLDASLLTPSLTADLSNPSSVRKEVFVPVFRPSPSGGPRWNGNVKKLNLKLVSSDSTTGNQYQYIDKNAADAIDSTDGRIAKSALTFWTDPAKVGTTVSDCSTVLNRDGRCSALGGAGQKIPGYVFAGGGNPGTLNTAGLRKLFYEKLGSTGVPSLGELAPNVPAVRDELRGVLAAPNNVNVLGAASDDEARALLRYARGYNVGTSAAPISSGLVSRDWMHGAVLHSRPVAINYGARSGFSEADPDIRVVYGAADGYMRMVQNSPASATPSADDTASTYGSETWAFMPRAVMRQQKVLRDNSPDVSMPYVYGTDGAPAVLVQDRGATVDAADGKTKLIKPADGKIESTNPNDRAWLFFGLRRSGNNYYAMNVTDPDDPKLMWRLGKDGLFNSTGLVGGSADQFSELAMTFSTPQIGRMNVADGTDSQGKTKYTPKPILVFGGGYNGGVNLTGVKISKDDRTAVSNDTIGNAIYVVNAETGELIWKGKHSLMEDSIASDVTIVDSDGDGLTDRLYVGDTGGRLWRGDMVGTDTTKWTVAPLANVGRHDSSTSDKRFFHAPDYAPVRDASGNYDVVLFGSGDRENPLDRTVSNYVYAYRDTRIVSGPAPTTVVTKTQTDFADLTECASGTASCGDKTKLNTTGWTFRLGTVNSSTKGGDGEKVLGQPLSTNGVVYFSTYTPPAALAANAPLPCKPSEGTNKFYGVALSDATAKVSQFTTTINDDQRSTTSLTPGLPGDFNALTASALSANAQTLKLVPPKPSTIYWRERRGDDEKAH